MPKVVRLGTWVHADVGSDRVMMNVETGDYVGLTPVAARIWDLLEGTADVDELCEGLIRAYDVTPEICRTEVDAFLAELSRTGAVRLER